MRTDIFLNEIKEAENGSEIATTYDYVGFRKVSSMEAFKEFKPLKPKNLVFIFFFPLIIYYYVTGRIFQPGSSTVSQIVELIVLYIMGVILFVNAYGDYSDETMTYKIRIDNFGISLNEVLYKWEDIYETAIMTKFTWGCKYKYLVIAMKDMKTYECINLANHVNLTFHAFEKKLAEYIELFKPFNTKSYAQRPHPM